MQHVHAGTCPECEREYYAIGIRDEDPKSLGTFFLYHVGDACAITPSYDELFARPATGAAHPAGRQRRQDVEAQAR